MRRPLPDDKLAPRPFLERIEQASARMLPYLVVVAVGLALVDVIGLMAMSAHLHVTRHPVETGSSLAPGCQTGPAAEMLPVAAS